MSTVLGVGELSVAFSQMVTVSWWCSDEVSTALVITGSPVITDSAAGGGCVAERGQINVHHSRSLSVA